MPTPLPNAAVPVLASVAVLVLATGFTSTLLPLVVADPRNAALVATLHFAGFLVGAPFAGRLAGRLGTARMALLFGLAIALGTGGLALTNDVAVLGALRVLAGVGVSGYFVLVESRLNDLARPATRGRLMGAYLVAYYAAQATGAAFAGKAGAEGAGWFLVLLPLPLLGVLPMMSGTGAPRPAVAAARTPAWRLLALAPTAFAASAAGGVLLGAFYGLAPVYVSAVGGAEAVGPFMAATMLGGMVVLGPLGRAADRAAGRAPWLAGVLVTAAGAAALLALVPAGAPWLLAAAGALFGAASFGLYPLASGCVNDAIPAGDRLAGNGLMLGASALGSCAGPAVAGWAMAGFGPGMFLVPAAMACLVAAAAVAAGDVRPRPAGRREPA